MNNYTFKSPNQYYVSRILDMLRVSSSRNIYLAVLASVGLALSISNNFNTIQTIKARIWLLLSSRQPVTSMNQSISIIVTDDDITNGEVLQSFPGSARKVVKVGPDIVVKLGPDVHMAEAEADSMKFIHDHTTIPVPKMLGAYEKNGYRYIVMEFVEGKLLQDTWPTLPLDDRAVILSELKDYVRQMRQIRSPNNMISSVTGGPVLDRRQLSSIKGGPFRSEADFNRWQLDQLKLAIPIVHRDMYTAMHKTDHKVVFSHGDFAFHNVIVRDGHVRAIIDWEFSGWLPEHWDYCKTLSFMSATDEDYLCCKEIFGQEYHMEYFMDLWFTREVRHGGF
jgi:serine/threonine protein kinase